jgi:hypothetical protein
MNNLPNELIELILSYASLLTRLWIILERKNGIYRRIIEGRTFLYHYITESSIKNGKYDPNFITNLLTIKIPKISPLECYLDEKCILLPRRDKDREKYNRKWRYVLPEEKKEYSQKAKAINRKSRDKIYNNVDIMFWFYCKQLVT